MAPTPTSVAFSLLPQIQAGLPLSNRLLKLLPVITSEVLLNSKLNSTQITIELSRLLQTRMPEFVLSSLVPE